MLREDRRDVVVGSSVIIDVNALEVGKGVDIENRGTQAVEDCSNTSD